MRSAIVGGLVTAFLIAFVAVLITVHDGEQSVRHSCEAEGRLSIGGGHAPIMCYDPKDGRVFVPRTKLPG